MQNNYHPHGFRILNEKMILNQTMLNEQNVDGPGMNDMSPGLAKDFWDWVSNLTPADWSAITALGAAARARCERSDTRQPVGRSNACVYSG